jgi:hypothetical protein
MPLSLSSEGKKTKKERIENKEKERKKRPRLEEEQIATLLVSKKNLLYCGR